MEPATLNLNIDGTQRTFFYRPGTVDEAVVVHGLKNLGYGFGPLRRAAELTEFYARVADAGKAPLIVDVDANIGAAAVYFALKFPKARVVAVEADENKFELLRMNLVSLPVECIRAAGAAAGRGALSVDEIYRSAGSSAAPFIVKFNVEADLPSFFADAAWPARTPVIMSELSDSLFPGTPNTRAFVDIIAQTDRDFAYVNGNIVSIGRAPLSF